MGFNRQCVLSCSLSHQVFSPEMFILSRGYCFSLCWLLSTLDCQPPGEGWERNVVKSFPCSAHTLALIPLPSLTVSCILCILSPSKSTYTGGVRFPLRGRFPGTGLQKTIAKVQPSLTGSPVPSRAALPFAVLDALKKKLF